VTGRLRPEVVVFDVVETLASLDPVAARLAEHGLGEHVLGAWFSRLLRDGMALTAAGGYAGFADVARSALKAETRAALTDDQIELVVDAFGELTPQPDAVAALRTARAAGMRVFTLTNGAAATTKRFLERAGIAGEVEQVLAIDEVRAWKPAAAPYEHAVAKSGVPAERVALVAVHSWDIYGARRAGLTTGWSPRLEGAPIDVFGSADITADTLDGVIAGLAALPQAKE